MSVALKLQSSILLRWFGALVLGGVLVIALPANAILPSLEPTAPPPGGQSSSFLDTSTAPQIKLGSLMVGQGGGARICLNGGNLNGGDDISGANPNGHCVTSWSSVLFALGGPFVNRYVANPGNPPNAVSSYQPADKGFVRLKGSGSGATGTFVSDVDSGAPAGVVALYSGTKYAEDYAGYFLGTLAIEPMPGGQSGKLCLNSTSDYINGGAYGCITDWSQISGAAITNNLKLQTAASPTVQTGTVNLSQAFNVGAAVFGSPPPPTDLPAVNQPFCGDGLCSNEIQENDAASPNYCLLDCENPNNLVSFTAATGAGSGEITLKYTTSSNPSCQGPLCKVSVVIARSTDPSFLIGPSTIFEPIDGLTYTTGSSNGVAVAWTLPSLINSSYGTNSPIIDSTGSPCQTFYYRAYQGNAYPRYAKWAAGGAGQNFISFQAKSGGTCFGGGGGGNSILIPPVGS